MIPGQPLAAQPNGDFSTAIWGQPNVWLPIITLLQGDGSKNAISAMMHLQRQRPGSDLYRLLQ